MGVTGRQPPCQHLGTNTQANKGNMATTTELFSGIGDKNSSKVLAPPGGKSSIGFDAPAPAPSVPKNSASAQKAKDLSTNPLAAIVQAPSGDLDKQDYTRLLLRTTIKLTYLI